MARALHGKNPDSNHNATISKAQKRVLQEQLTVWRSGKSSTQPAVPASSQCRSQTWSQQRHTNSFSKGRPDAEMSSPPVSSYPSVQPTERTSELLVSAGHSRGQSVAHLTSHPQLYISPPTGPITVPLSRKVAMQLDYCLKLVTDQQMAERHHVGRHVEVFTLQQCNYRSYAPSLESVLSRMLVPLHGTQCPNTSVLNLTFVLLRKLHLFNLAFNVHWHSGFYIVCDSWNAPWFSMYLAHYKTNALDDDDDDDDVKACVSPYMPVEVHDLRVTLAEEWSNFHIGHSLCSY